MQDFEQIIISFNGSEYVSSAKLQDKCFIINIDLERMEQLTWKQLEITPPEVEKKKNGTLRVHMPKNRAEIVIIQWFGNLAYVIFRAFYRYNKDRHPETVKVKGPEPLAESFMISFMEKIKKDSVNWKRYTV